MKGREWDGEVDGEIIDVYTSDKIGVFGSEGFRSVDSAALLVREASPGRWESRGGQRH